VNALAINTIRQILKEKFMLEESELTLKIGKQFMLDRLFSLKIMIILYF